MATVLAAGAADPAFAAPWNRRRVRRRPTVAVFGGGIAGLTAAHELAERGFKVTVYERRAWGGKARSTWVPKSAAARRLPLPGEHGWRTFFGFYENTSDTMRRIPFESNPNGVFDNLAGSTEALLALDGGRPNLSIDLGTDRSRGFAPGFIAALAGELPLYTDITPAAAAYFISRLIVYMSSCEGRRLGQWENTPWTAFTGSDRFGGDYRRVLVNAFSEVVQASKAERTSAAFCGLVLERFVYNVLGRYSNGPLVRFLNRPSNEALFDPWLALLGTHGVDLRLHHSVEQLLVGHGRIVGAQIRTPKGHTVVEHDHYVSALPVERARRLWTREIIAADPQLDRMWKLDTGWMNGLKFFLRGAPTIAAGIVDYVDSPWRLTSVSQAQFWPLDFAATYGDGQVRESLSVIVSDWTTPGVLYGKPAKECTPKQVVTEVWEQMKAHLNKPGQPPLLMDEQIVATDIDRGMVHHNGRLLSRDPLVLPTAGQRADRPETVTAIPNLILAGDYLQTNGLQVANMEVANYNGRLAANAVLAASGSHADPAATFGQPRPPEWADLKRIDAERYAAGQPNLFDLPPDSPVTGLLALIPRVPAPFGDILQTLTAGLSPEVPII